MNPAEKTAIDGSVLEDWTQRFAAAVAATVRKFAAEHLSTPVALFAVDCHPWHGSLGLGVLTAEEADANDQLMDSAEMAAWRHFHFSDGLASWSAAAVLGREMREAYEATSDRQATTTAYLTACARAAASAEVTEAIKLFNRDDRFRISVAHPDDGGEYFRPASEAGV